MYAKKLLFFSFPSLVTIVVISRLVYRKGIDLLATIIPIICRMHSKIEFIIGGDGPKRAMLNDVIKQNKLEDRVQLIGAVKNDEVRNVLIKGDIFLNSSLTEAFCIAIVEAVSCGLQVVTTNVGGIPEVLPSDLIWLGEPTVNGLIGALERAIKDFESGNVVCALEAHNRIRKYYRWPEIAKRTEIIYDSLRDSFDYKIDDKGLNDTNFLSADDGDKLVNDENDYNYLNKLNNTLNGKFDRRKDLRQNGFRIVDEENRSTTATRKVLYENQMQFIDLNYLRENQDKTGFRSLLKQCYRSGWIFGSFLLFLLFIEYVMKMFCDWWSPESQIDISPTTILVNSKYENAANQQNNKIRIEKNNNSVLKINKNKFKSECINWDLYRTALDRNYFVNLVCEENKHNQFTFDCTLSDLSCKSTNLLVLKSTNLLTNHRNCGLKTNELMNHQTSNSRMIVNKDLDMNNHLVELEESINHCEQIEHFDKLNNYETTEFNLIDSKNIENEDEAINDDEEEQKSNEEETMEESSDFASDYRNYIEFSNDNLIQTIQFDDDEFEQEKKSTNSKESTSGYNTSNSCEDSDNNSTNSSNSDLDNLSSYRSIEKRDNLKLDSTNHKIKKRSKLNASISPTIKQKLTSLLIFKKQNREAKDKFSNSKLKSQPDYLDNDDQFSCYQNDCKRTMSILIKN